MRMNSRRLLLASLVTLAAGCSKSTDSGNSNNNGNGTDSGTPTPTNTVPQRPAALPASQVECGKGSATLNGNILAPNGTTPVAGAFIYVASGDCWAGTDANGAFTVRGVPSGATQVHMEKGLFQAASSATPGTPVSLKVDGARVKLAYVEGTYDNVQAVLEHMGFQATRIPAEDLNTADLSPYAGVFLSCGLSEFYAQDEGTQKNLRAYVQNGGVLYASDWAADYVQSTFPGHITFLSPDPRNGGVGDPQASVLDEGLKRALGRSTATIHFETPSWEVMDSVAAGTQVLVSGPVVDTNDSSLGNHPYLVQFQEGKGRVTYTSFHNAEQSTADMDLLLQQLLFSL